MRSYLAPQIIVNSKVRMILGLVLLVTTICFPPKDPPFVVGIHVICIHTFFVSNEMRNPLRRACCVDKTQEANIVIYIYIYIYIYISLLSPPPPPGLSTLWGGGAGEKVCWTEWSACRALPGRGAASGILGLLEQIQAYLVGMRTGNRIPYKIPPVHTL